MGFAPGAVPHWDVYDGNGQMTNAQRDVTARPASPRSRVPIVIVILIAAFCALVILLVFVLSLEIGLRHARPRAGSTPVPPTVTTSAGVPAPSTPIERSASTGLVPPPTGTPGGGPSKGIIAARGAAGDIEIGAPVVVGSTAEVMVVITNHSSQTSSYVVQIALDAADGVTQLDTCSVLVRSVHSGESTSRPAVFIGRKTLPAGSTAAVKAVQRLAD
jgi:hypothetical protein